MTKAKAYAAFIITSVITGGGSIVALGVLPERWRTTAVTALAVLTVVGTTLGVYRVPNQPTS